MSDRRPGLNAQRLLALMEQARERCSLNLQGAVVLTEAATGSYAVTPVLAAMAGARVYARTRETRYGTFQQVSEITNLLAGLAGVSDRISLATEIPEAAVREADIVTNSGHLRPIDAGMIGAMKSTAVIPLMFEAWEFRAGDLDLEACARRGIPIGGTNERHPDVDVFSFLGIMAVKLLLDAGVAVYGSRLLLLCDNPFAPFIERGLRGAGALVETRASGMPSGTAAVDAVVVALTPAAGPVLMKDQMAEIARHSPGAIIAQFWGDIERPGGAPAVWPAEPPPAGHMGILPSAVGPEPIVRLQCGGLKVGEILWRQRIAGKSCAEALHALEASGYGGGMDT